MKNYKVSRGKHSKDYKKISKSWLDRKLYDKSVVDTFLKKNFSNKNDTKYVYDINKKIIEFDKNNLSVVIFSQNLEDALYDDGLDGFDDVFHWLKFTINNCLENKNISKIYIKYARASPVNPAPIDKIAKIARVNPSGKCVTSR